MLPATGIHTIVIKNVLVFFVDGAVQKNMFVFFLLACTEQPHDTYDTSALLPVPEDRGDEIFCSTEPVDGVERFTLETHTRGFQENIPDLRELTKNEDARQGAGLAAGDIDLDGDIDIIAARFTLSPLLYLNDGSGHFTENSDVFAAIEQPDDLFSVGGTGMMITIGLVDLNADRLPELIASGLGFLAVYPNLGGGVFDEPRLIRADHQINGMYLGLASGDMDGDGDLDLAIVSELAVDTYCDEGNEKCVQDLFPDYIYRNDGELKFSLSSTLYSDATQGSHAMLGLFTDRDRDGDLDFFVPKDFLGENAFWRNDGNEWVNDVQVTGADYTWSAMGIDSVDLNGDAFLDYCLTDVGPMRCMLSVAKDTYAESSAFMNLFPNTTTDPGTSVGWSIRFSDFDNDGWWDVSYTGAPMGRQEKTKIESVSDRMWFGLGDGIFTDVSAAAGFNDSHDHYAMVHADVDGDGFVELLISGPGRPIQFYDNACNNNHWTAIHFDGPPSNPEGWGAVVTVEAGGRTWMRELFPIGHLGHSPPVVYIGLGDIDRIDRITASWPDGSIADVTDLPTRQPLWVQSHLP